MTKEFVRDDSRVFTVSDQFPVIVAICGEGELLRRHFKSETDAGKIVLVLTPFAAFAELNGDKLAIADELFVLNISDGYTDFEAAMFLSAQKLMKHIRVLND